MRGKVDTIMLDESSMRITPAYAGKRQAPTSGDMYTEDHPRLCGEKLSALLRRNPQIGSPPPMRGKAVNAHVAFLHIGITPAYAGKSENPADCSVKM